MAAVSVLTYNVNGIRSAISKGFLKWLADHSFDIVCLQEIKAQEDQLDFEAFEALGYSHYWHTASKKGYSGVGILSKLKPDNVCYGCGIEEYDNEGRVIQADFGNTTIINTYFPSGSMGAHRQEVKYRFLNDYFEYIKGLRQLRPRLVICGDYNIAHKEIDIHNPKRNATMSGFLPEEREWLTNFFDSGFIDALRHFDDSPNLFTWWSFFYNSRKNNKGWRIDYISVSAEMDEDLVSCRILPDAVHSDHCPVLAEINL